MGIWSVSRHGLHGLQLVFCCGSISGFLASQMYWELMNMTTNGPLLRQRDKPNEIISCKFHQNYLKLHTKTQINKLTNNSLALSKIYFITKTSNQFMQYWQYLRMMHNPACYGSFVWKVCAHEWCNEIHALQLVRVSQVVIVLVSAPMIWLRWKVCCPRSSKRTLSELL